MPHLGAPLEPDTSEDSEFNGIVSPPDADLDDLSDEEIEELLEDLLGERRP